MPKADLDTVVHVTPLQKALGRLNYRQKLFVQEYVVDFNAAQAYVRAGYDVEDMDLAAAAASRLLASVKVQAALDELQCERIERLEVDGDWAIVRLYRIYLAAMQSDDLAAANKAVENICKVLGHFERDNRQRAGTDLEAARERLRALGFPVDKFVPPPRRVLPGAAGAATSGTDAATETTGAADAATTVPDGLSDNGVSIPGAAGD
jgi:hypothetical protein